MLERREGEKYVMVNSLCGGATVSGRLSMILCIYVCLGLSLYFVVPYLLGVMHLWVSSSTFQGEYWEGHSHERYTCFWSDMGGL